MIVVILQTIYSFSKDIVNDAKDQTFFVKCINNIHRTFKKDDNQSVQVPLMAEDSNNNELNVTDRYYLKSMDSSNNEAKIVMRKSSRTNPGLLLSSDREEIDDEFLYAENETVPFAESRSNENNDQFPLNDCDDERTIAEVHDEFLRRNVNREDDDTKVDGYYGDELYDIDDKPSNIGYTDFATY
jgi:hypothetical protein